MVLVSPDRDRNARERLLGMLFAESLQLRREKASAVLRRACNVVD